MQSGIQLIVGLGNPGSNYAETRHNVGAWFVEMLANDFAKDLKVEPKFLGRIARISIEQQDYWLLIPTTFMNHSGMAVKTMSHFYKIPTEAILVVHDELDLSPGIARFKENGGHAGHNGLRDIINHLNSNDFNRLRIGIGHPGHRDLVSDYVLHPPSKKERELILDSFQATNKVLPIFLTGNYQRAMAQLHNNSIIKE